MSLIAFSFSDLTTVGLALCFLIGLFFYQRIVNPAIRWLIIYSGVALLPDLYYLIATDPEGLYMRIFYCIMFPLEYALYVNIFYPVYNDSSRLSLLLITSIAGILFYATLIVLTRIGERTAAQDIFWVTSIASLLLALLYFQRIIRSGQIVQLNQEPLFWIATGILFFYTGNLIATGFYHRLLVHSKTLARNLYYLNYLLNIIRYILYSIAFYVAASTEVQRDER
ncbi:hypothetical protein [Spirosoma koreense]